MKGILINPYTQRVEPIEDDFRDYKRIYPALTQPGAHTVDCFTVISLPSGDTLYLDDNGHLSGGHACFTYRDYDGGVYPLPGRGLILGSTDEGDTADTTLTVEQVTAAVGWPNVRTTGDFQPPAVAEEKVQHPIFGEIVQINASLPIVERDRPMPAPSIGSIKTADDWWAVAEKVLEAEKSYGWMDDDLREALTSAVQQKDAKAAFIAANAVWLRAPDAPVIHSWPGWGGLCDLCSEAWAIQEQVEGAQ